MVEPSYNVTKITLILSLCGFIMGMDVSSLSIFLRKDDFNHYFNDPSPLKGGFAMAASPMGGLFGCLLYNTLEERHGRVSLFRLGSMLWVKGSIMAIFSVELWLVVFSRWMKGVAVGMFSILVAAYVDEVVPKRKKGQTMACVQLGFSLSMLTVYYMCIALDFLSSPLSFRLAWGLEMIPGICSVFLTLWLPESPQWLTLHGEYSRAEELQNKLAREYNKASGSNKVKVYSKLELACVYGDGSEKFGYRALLSRECWRQTLMGSTLQLLVQISGINILMYYIIFICDMLGLKGTVRVVSASMPYIINAVFGLLPIIFMDYVRRKDLILGGAFPLSVIMLTIGIIMASKGHKTEPNIGDRSIMWSINEKAGPPIMGLCFLFVSIFAVTLSSGPWVYTTEILPTRAKHKGLAICMLLGWLANFILTLLGPVMLANLTWGTFILLGASTFIIALIILLFFPETKNMTPEEVDCLFAKSSIGSESTAEESVDTRTKNENNAIGTGNDLGPISMVNQEGVQFSG